MTCRKAKAWLSQVGEISEERDFFKERLSESEIMALIDGRDPADFFSFASPSFKATGLHRDELSNEQLVTLMAEEPRYIRRPIAVVDGNPIPGASVKVLEGVFGPLA